MKSCHVLIVEDDEDLRGLIAEILEGDGFPVETAPNGLAALQRMKAGYSPDVILTNLLMPVLDGYALNAELKRHQGWDRIPLIVLTAGKVHPEALTRVQDILMKPIDIDTLLASVKSACRARSGSS